MIQKPNRSNYAATPQGEIAFADACVEYMRACRREALDAIKMIDAADARRAPNTGATALERDKEYKRKLRAHGPTLADILAENPMLRALHKEGKLFDTAK